MPDTFPLLQKEGKLLYTVSHSSPEFKLTAMWLGGDNYGLWVKLVHISDFFSPVQILPL
jgi:hypothetical protein